MDEATANIDFQKDEKIQKLIMECFRNTTLITIAHRIQNILSHDKILVLEKGQIVEFDSPANLLKDKNSSFFKLNNNIEKS